jgi:predicted amidohydrolase YtcJ
MARNTIPRRDLLKRAAAGAAATVAVGRGFSTPSAAQTTTTRPSASPIIRPADLILKNGKVITLNASFTIAQAIAIAGDRIVAVGPDAAMAAHTAPGTRVIDLKGKVVIPGLVDGHAHMDREGLKGVYPSLAGARSIRDIQDRIAKLARKARPGDWVVTMPIGDPPFYWDVPESLAEKRWPTRQELDSAAPNHPVFIRPIWGFWRHTLPLVSCANTEALRRAGITRDTVSPVEAVKIEKDSNGDPTGAIMEFDYQPLAELTWFRQAGGFPRTDRALGLPMAAQAYHAYGTTSIFEEHGVANELLRAYKDAYRDGKLTMRAALAFSPNWKAVAGVPVGPLIEAWAGWLGEPGLGDDWLRITGLAFGIGRGPSDELRASAAPYTGWAGFNYDASLPRQEAKELLLHCARNDIRAVALDNLSPGLIDLYEEVDREVSLKGRRWVLGHIHSLSPAEIERIARMGLVVTPHTNRYIFKEGHLLQKKLPPERHREIAPMRDLISAGVSVGLVTDNVPVSMFWPIWEVVSRLSRVTNERVAPEQALTRAEALRCATMNNAYLTFDEAKKGSLEPGKLADLAVLSADPLSVEEIAIRDLTAVMTMVGGNIVHEKQNWFG